MSLRSIAQSVALLSFSAHSAGASVQVGETELTILNHSTVHTVRIQTDSHRDIAKQILLTSAETSLIYAHDYVYNNGMLDTSGSILHMYTA